VKRPTDYDDVVRDYRKRTNYLSNLTYQFNRDCGKVIEAVMAKMANQVIILETHMHDELPPFDISSGCNDRWATAAAYVPDTRAGVTS